MIVNMIQELRERMYEQSKKLQEVFNRKCKEQWNKGRI